MKFYDCDTAPSPQRVRILMAEKGIEIPVVQVDLRNGEQLGEDFRKLNPDCTVPVLELDDGTTLTEVFAICQYLESQYPEPNLLGRDPREQALVTMWNSKVEQQGLAALAEMFRNKAKGFSSRALPGPLDIEQIPALAQRGHRRALAFYERLDGRLRDSDYLAGDRFTLADITAWVMVRFGGWSKIEIGESQAALRRWFDEVSARPSVNS